MDWSPKDVIEWYKKQPSWLKIVLSVVFVVAIVLAAIWWLLGKPTGQDYPSKSNTLGAVTEALETKHQNAYEDTKKQSAENQAAIEEEQTKRLRLKEERQKGKAKHDKEQKELDSVNLSADDVVSLLNEQRERRSR